MAVLLFHKPYGVLSQFTPEPGSSWASLAAFIDVPGVYAAGRLDADSEGLLLLTSSGPLQQRLTDPRWGHWRRYAVQVEGTVTPDHLQQLRSGMIVQGKRTLPAKAALLADPAVAERQPPIRHRLSVPTGWLELELREGRNRQVRRMTAAVGLPTLRLIRTAIDLMDGQAPLNLEGLAPGQWRQADSGENARLEGVLRRPAVHSPGRGGRAGGGKGGQGGAGG
ncbi:pseudouridine synthase [Synechococcus sp. CS-602]|uniref:pseudouridine synthase n=1 Tax=Synechococcaceae TaxID=1890426 RepID=UPI0008FF63B3|nr:MULTISPECIES: pseudouridine synthase [Synechococcaceae]MCT4364688.1 pseudouridine synthase [Candidatus Regnicoccus frigidus MAG-AL1]APD48769.1 pseudouridine synthase [Synechococcus sp. SynAce01]MCT0203874.1 pseudouridine synthase [Synechococcus sp. CS-602]MCT0244728.1 pseudouridine synthase [Synechococcus sp. CS-601]MCT4366598.1 pseudouridine synthase [Candidatus Regnicoccus frigidus MAG-AL2]